jgi:hypothetical protein
MSDEKARQTAENHYYEALDLVAEGHHERAVAEYQASLNADPTFTEAMHGLARALQNLNRLTKPSRWPTASPKSIPTTFSPTPASPSFTRKKA